MRQLVRKLAGVVVVALLVAVSLPGVKAVRADALSVGQPPMAPCAGQTLRWRIPRSSTTWPGSSVSRPQPRAPSLSSGCSTGAATTTGPPTGVWISPPWPGRSPPSAARAIRPARQHLPRPSPQRLSSAPRSQSGHESQRNPATSAHQRRLAIAWAVLFFGLSLAAKTEIELRPKPPIAPLALRTGHWIVQWASESASRRVSGSEIGCCPWTGSPPTRTSRGICWSFRTASPTATHSSVAMELGSSWSSCPLRPGSGGPSTAWWWTRASRWWAWSIWPPGCSSGCCDRFRPGRGPSCSSARPWPRVSSVRVGPAARPGTCSGSTCR